MAARAVLLLFSLLLLIVVVLVAAKRNHKRMDVIIKLLYKGEWSVLGRTQQQKLDPETSPTAQYIYGGVSGKLIHM